MKYFIFYVALFFNYSSKAQEILIKDISKEQHLVKVFENNFKLYTDDCSDTIINSLINEIAIKYANDNVKSISISNLKFTCFDLKDSILLKEIYETLLHKMNLKNRKCFTYNIWDQSNVYIFSLSIFSKKNFKKYIRKISRSRLYIEHPTGKIKGKKLNLLSKYSTGYIIAKVEGELQLFKVK